MSKVYAPQTAPRLSGAKDFRWHLQEMHALHIQKDLTRHAEEINRVGEQQDS